MVVPVDDKAPDVVFMGLEGGGIAVSQVSPQLCLHSGHHLQGVEGLCDVIVRSNGKELSQNKMYYLNPRIT